MNIEGTRVNEPLNLGLNMYARPLALRVAITSLLDAGGILVNSKCYGKQPEV